MTDRPRVFTLGHSNRPIERFLDLAQRHGIERIVDVRSVPYSRFNPQFKRAALEASLRSAGIAYEFLGEQLGARPADPALYEEGRVSYAKLAATPGFQQGLSRVIEQFARERLALMCAERDPLDCHRTILVARELHRAGIPVVHILADGSLEEHERTMERLVQRLGIEGPDLFQDPARMAELACDLQARRIARPQPTTDSGANQSPSR